MDDWLDEQGLYRKNIALDGSCLFRAVADYLLPTNPINGHLVLRRQVCQYMREHEEDFVDRVVNDFDEYMEALSQPKGWGSPVELEAISRLYKVEFLLYFGPEAPLKVTDNKNTDEIILCVTNESFYEIVYPKSHIDNLGFCQSITYKVLYQEVFKMTEIDYAVHKMLHDKAARALRERFLQEQGIRDDLHEICPEQYVNVGIDGKINVREVIDSGAILFPYKVAKALDPDIYRNINFDVWVDSTRVGRRSSFWFGSGGPLRIGGRCQVRIGCHVFHAYIHELSADRGPAVVYIEELSQRRQVEFEDLIAIPRSYLRPEVTFKTHMMTKNGPPPVKREKDTPSMMSQTVIKEETETSGMPFAMRTLIHTPFQPSQVVNKFASFSVKSDFSDLPLDDHATLQFFYNLGIQFFHQGVYTTEPYGNHTSGLEELPYAVNDYEGAMLYKPNEAFGPRTMDPGSPMIMTPPPPPPPFFHLPYPTPAVSPMSMPPPPVLLPPLMPPTPPDHGCPPLSVPLSVHCAQPPAVLPLPTPPLSFEEMLMPPLEAMAIQDSPSSLPPFFLEPPTSEPEVQSTTIATPPPPTKERHRYSSHGKFVKPPRFRRMELAKRSASDSDRGTYPSRDDLQVHEVTSTSEEYPSLAEPVTSMQENMMGMPPPFYVNHPVMPQMEQGCFEGTMPPPCPYILPFGPSIRCTADEWGNPMPLVDSEGNYIYGPSSENGCYPYSPNFYPGNEVL